MNKLNKTTHQNYYEIKNYRFSPFSLIFFFQHGFPFLCSQALIVWKWFFNGFPNCRKWIFHFYLFVIVVVGRCSVLLSIYCSNKVNEWADPPDEYGRIAQWLNEHFNAKMDRQMAINKQPSTILLPLTNTQHHELLSFQKAQFLIYISIGHLK